MFAVRRAQRNLHAIVAKGGRSYGEATTSRMGRHQPYMEAGPSYGEAAALLRHGA